MRHLMFRIAALSGMVSLGTWTACAQTVRVWPGVAPGSEKWTQQERVEKLYNRNMVFNVVTPTLTLYLPEKSKAAGAGVIIAPGGAFLFLSIDSEGHEVARWLQQKGIAGFVLKYRVMETPASGFTLGTGRSAAANPASGTQSRGGGGRGPSLNMEDSSKYGIADGIQALKLVRQHAAEWGVSPDKIGFMGFSAGAMVTSGTLLQEDAAARPNFAAPIYGGPFGTMPPIPADLPPIFLAWAQDDTLVGPMVLKFYDALKAAGYKPEVHIFSAGGHGFGMDKKGTSSDHWIEAFYYWLESQGFTKPANRNY